MTKEDFKASVIRQFSKQDGDILTLMVEPNRELRKQNGIYLDSCMYYHSDFNLEIHLQKIDLGEGCFRVNVTFIEIENNSVNWNSVKDRNIAHPDFMKRVFYKETVDFEKGKVKFAVVPFKFAMDTSNFEPIYERKKRVLEYDIDNKRFSAIHPKRIISKWTPIREKAVDTVYMDFVFTDKKANEFRIFGKLLRWVYKYLR